MSATPSTEAPSSFWTIARRPRWIGALILALGVAAGFAALGQWQIGRAVETAVTSGPDTERAIPLDRLDRPQTGVSNAEAGRIATVSGRFVARDTAVVSDRYRIGVRDGLGGATGWWTLGRLQTSDGASLVVALGWAPTRARAVAAAGDLPAGEVSLRGRYTVSEPADTDDPQQGKRTVVSTAALVNQWPGPGPYYSGYLISDRGFGGLERIVSPPPSQQTQLGLLNLFYAVEWAIFAGFALYLWYRLVKDVLEKETESALEPVPLSGGS